MADFVVAVDQGTTSTRFTVFDHAGNEVAKHQLEHQQVLPRPGWVEHKPALGAHLVRRPPGARHAGWKKAVDRTLNWVDVG